MRRRKQHLCHVPVPAGLGQPAPALCYDAQGRPHAGALGQPRRVGGASPAGLPALQVFARNLQARIVRASMRNEVTPDGAAPDGTGVVFDGPDPAKGRVVSYACVAEVVEG